MILHAISQSLHDLASAIGWVGVGVIIYFLLVAVFTWAFDKELGGETGRERRLAEDLIALEEQHRNEIACWGSGRRGRERSVGPESRERLPFSGRRSAQ
jgi:hypothetical protein